MVLDAMDDVVQSRPKMDMVQLYRGANPWPPAPPRIPVSLVGSSSVG